VNPIRLSRPPIREAILDIQTDGPQDISAIQKLAETFGRGTGLTKIGTMRAGIVEMAMAAGQAFSGKANDIGVVGFRAEDDPLTRVAQFRNTGFGYSLIGNYDTWESFRDRAIVPARQFLALPGVGQIKRVALRYVNVIQFPGPRVDLDEYLPAAPKVPTELPQVVGSFLSRIVLPIPDARLVAIITQAIDESARPTPSVILDIDVYYQEVLAADMDAVLPILETIRTWKNKIFFSFVNEKTVRLHS